ncbi:MAG: DNA translocase FtsK [Anaerolineae bacterium]|nr:DNA translocase FtsK [Anaerolineae bacterium]MDW8173037.1 DNA translocase FtsK [Anaerolineae bacterium]
MIPSQDRDKDLSAPAPPGPPITDSAEAPQTFWDDLRDSLPPWMDEIIALTLIIFGLLSFLALFNPEQAVAARTWSNILRSMFGHGSVLVALGLFLMGLIFLLPRLNVSVKLPPSRTLAIEIGFLSLLGILHLLSDGQELRASARAGEGGGILGWGISALPAWLLGRDLALGLFAFVILLCLLVIVGVRRGWIIHWLNTNGQRLLDYSQSLRPAPPSAVRETISAPEPSTPLPAPGLRRTPIMRIRPNRQDLPPSLRPSGAVRNTPEPTNLPAFKSERGEIRFDFNIIGEVTQRKTEDGHRIVIRPDGREKRYFSLSEQREARKVGKRDSNLPPLDLLQDGETVMPSDEEINRTVVLIENTLLEFDIDIDVINVQVGPTVTRYAVQPYHTRKDGSTERTRLNKIASYANDLALALSAKRLRLEVPVAGTNYMGIEVPNKQPSVVSLRSVYESKAFHEQAQKSTPLLVPLGRDVSGNVVNVDLARMPHTLIAGTTGSGKSVCIAAIAAALIMNNLPHKVKLIMLDPKMVELSRFNGIPHLLGPVEIDAERILGVLKWCTREMDRRYQLLEEHAVRNIDSYNAQFGTRRRGRDYLPYIVIMVDEIGDLMLTHGEEMETSITRLAQMARAVGMHLVIATQRPSVDVITGLIKANFPARIAFAVASSVDSRVILDASGAEALLGRGDMLFLAPDAAAPRRVQGCYISDDEVRSLVEYWTDWYQKEVLAGKLERQPAPWERGVTQREFLAETDHMLEEAIQLVVETQEASASIIQRRLNLGYPRAARLMDLLTELGVVGELVGGGKARRVLIPRGEDPFKRIIENRMKQRSEAEEDEDSE